MQFPIINETSKLDLGPALALQMTTCVGCRTLEASSNGATAGPDADKRRFRAGAVGFKGTTFKIDASYFVGLV